MTVHKVTLYIPCYNAERFISRCLEGVMRQTYPIDEVLVIDDGCADDTVRIASTYPVKIIRHGENRGLAAARNTAFRNARNGFVAAVDADCVPEPDWLKKLMKNFTGEAVAGIGGRLIEGFRETLPDRWRSVHMKQHWGEEKEVDPDFLFGSNTVHRKAAIQDVGDFCEKYRTNYEDVDICRRLKKKGYILIYEPEAVVQHLLEDSLSSLLNRTWRWYHPHADAWLDTRAGRLELRRRAGRLARASVPIVISDLKGSAALAAVDISQREYSLVAIDLLLAFYTVAKRVRSVLFQRR